jgi:hypothetical protein
MPLRLLLLFLRVLFYAVSPLKALVKLCRERSLEYKSASKDSAALWSLLIADDGSHYTSNITLCC